MSNPDAASIAIDAQALVTRLQQLAEFPPVPREVRSWLHTWSKLKCEAQTMWSDLLVATYRNTNDQVARENYRYFLENWIPIIDEENTNLAQLAVRFPEDQLASGLAARICSEANEQNKAISALLSQERLLINQYNSIIANRQVVWKGQQYLPSEIEQHITVTTDRATREALWRSLHEVELEQSAALDQIFSELLRVRQLIGVQAGKHNYAEYAWGTALRDYTPEQAIQFLDDFGRVFAPLFKEMNTRHAQQLGLEHLRPWDVSTSALTAEPLPTSEYLPLAQRVLRNIDQEFGDTVQEMEVRQSFDLLPRLGKRAKNVEAFAMARGESELLCNLTGGTDDFRVLLHELGHSIHKQRVVGNPNFLFWDFVAFNDVQEFYAFVFEYIGNLNMFSILELDERGKRLELNMIAKKVLTRYQDVDERLRLELWMYSQNRIISAEDIEERYLKLIENNEIDWSDLENIRKKQWQKHHTFLYSFYNIEYAIAMTGALIFVHHYQQQEDSAVERLKRAICLGGTHGAIAIFGTLGITFPFSEPELVLARQTLASWLQEATP